jgi:hypothetical protein
MELSAGQIREWIRQALEEWLGPRRVVLARKWQGGTLRFQPGDPNLKPKDVPIDVFIKKLTSVRERLRVLEQKLNHHDGLSEMDRTEFQALITRAYGSLTTFNVFFQEEEDKFSGSGGRE